MCEWILFTFLMADMFFMTCIVLCDQTCYFSICDTMVEWLSSFKSALMIHQLAGWTNTLHSSEKLRQGGPAMKGSAEYPKGFAKHIFKLHTTELWQYLLNWQWFKFVLYLKQLLFSSLPSNPAHVSGTSWWHCDSSFAAWRQTTAAAQGWMAWGAAGLGKTRVWKNSLDTNLYV